MPEVPEPTRNPDEVDSRQFAVQAARLLSDGRCRQTVVLDVRGLSPVTDYLVISTGTSDRQMKSVAGDVKRYGKLVDWEPYGFQGEGAAQWVVADFVNVVVHVFAESTRFYYDLESLWADAKPVDWEAVTQAGHPAHLLGGVDQTIDSAEPSA